ncbi:MAG: NYN domain-containing protein [Phycisphaerae bacterium]|nr:NYN domain-containing protein [Phycisphaerae bacterium]
MPVEPVEKRAIAFFDAQNLFYAAKYAFGYKWPNYDPRALASAVCANKGWDLKDIYFYTGVPSAQASAFWNHFWTAKLAVMGTRGIKAFSRGLKYRNQTVLLGDGSTTTVLVGQEKGIDVRLALDVVRLARGNEYDVGLIFSQDQDLSEVADEVRSISVDQDRWIKIACAYPVSPTYKNSRGINGTDWIGVKRVLYDACIDPKDYRPKPKT